VYKLLGQDVGMFEQAVKHKGDAAAPVGVAHSGTVTTVRKPDPAAFRAFLKDIGDVDPGKTRPG
jgi:hypothetical protein